MRSDRRSEKARGRSDWVNDSMAELAWLTAWLTDWLTDWLTERLTDWLSDLLIYWLALWLRDRWINILTDLLTDWSTDWLTGWLTDWLSLDACDGRQANYIYLISPMTSLLLWVWGPKLMEPKYRKQLCPGVAEFVYCRPSVYQTVVTYVGRCG